MKKKIALILAAALALTSLAGCGKKKEEEVKRSGQFEINVDECVKEVCDYSKVPVTLVDNYQVTDEVLNQYCNYFLANVGMSYIEVKDRKVIQEGDIILLGYKGFHGEKQFEGGSTTQDIYFDVYNNYDLSNNISYVDGFNTGLKGATVGEDASSTLTFPEKYSNEELAGQEVVFHFDIKGIYKAVNMENVTDAMIKEAFEEELKVTTVEEYVKYVKENLEAFAAQQKETDTVSAIRDYLVENSKVEIPEGYEDARYREYIAQLEKELPEGTTLESYVKTYYNLTLTEAEEKWREVLNSEIKAEILIKYIAKKDGIELDEEGYKTYINNFITSNSDIFKDENSVYEYYGSGYADEGEAYIRDLYVVNLGLRKIMETAVVELTPAEKEEDAKDK